MVHADDWYRRKRQIETFGIGKVRLVPQVTGNLVSLRVVFHPGFKHMIRPHRVERKMNADSGFHITITYVRDLEDKPALKDRWDNFVKTYFQNEHDGRIMDFPEVSVAKAGTLMLHGDREFDKELKALVDEGSGKDGGPHISLD